MYRVQIKSKLGKYVVKFPSDNAAKKEVARVNDTSIITGNTATYLGVFSALKTSK